MGTRLLANLDLVVLALAGLVFLAADLSLVGYAVAAVAWLAQRGVQVALQRRADASRDPKVVVGLLAGGAMGRAWLTALSVLAVGLVDERAGLPAVLLILILFTVHFTLKIVQRGLSL